VSSGASFGEIHEAVKPPVCGAIPAPAPQTIKRGACVREFKKVLIVEDEEVLAENLRVHFVRSGWEARIAGTGKAALAAADEFLPEMILLDYNLPDMNGFQALESIRSANHCCSCVMMTARPVETVRTEARRHEIGRILSKPFAMADLQTQLSATAAEFCSACLANGKQASRSGCHLVSVP
jgi:DNA-binding response OmpR family regulator